jgi:DNA replication licensing factor MCM5
LGQVLKFVEKTTPIAVYTSRKGSSAAGITTSVTRDSNLVGLPSLCYFFVCLKLVSSGNKLYFSVQRELYLEGVAILLADGGVVYIDEFDKMSPEDR